ncbi:hypothetical protein [Corallococcus sp. 4LFB]|uniref:hypothetical protein n=1 Tax=Corallococcus sp. 4LFB TaxID=3383249 RepID=UPI0039749F7A
MQVADVWSSREVWIRALSEFLGGALRLVAGSEIVRDDAAYGTLRDALASPHTGVALERVVELQVTQLDSGEFAVWALVFFFIGKQRVAPAGQCFLSLQWKDGCWFSRGWEADVHEEWTGLKTLDPERL